MSLGIWCLPPLADYILAVGRLIKIGATYCLFSPRVVSIQLTNYKVTAVYGWCPFFIGMILLIACKHEDNASACRLMRIPVLLMKCRQNENRGRSRHGCL